MQNEQTVSKPDGFIPNVTSKKLEVTLDHVESREIAKLLKKKNLTTCMKSSKKTKLNPAPNISCARRKSEGDTMSKQPTETTETQAVLTNAHSPQRKLEEELNNMRSEYIRLKQKLLQNAVNQSNNEKTSPNFESKNRFSCLDIDQDNELEMKDIDQEMDSDTDTSPSIIQKLKKKNLEITRVTSPQKTKTKKQSTDTNSQISGSQFPNSQGTQVLRRKPPPINIFHQDPKDTSKLINDTLKIDNFYIKRINEFKHTLHINDIENYNKVKELLKKAKTNFYSFTPKTEKNLTFLLKGLNCTFEEKEVLAELQNMNIEGLQFLKLSRFSTRRSIQEQRTLPIFIVQLTHNSNPGLLKQIQYIAHQVVHWERFRRKDIIQCIRCQRLGHAAANCNLKYRCVKCKEGHDPGMCSVDKNNKQVPFCINCNSEGHPASYRGCPKILEIKNKILNKAHKINIDREKKIAKINKYISPHITYAEAANKNTQVPQKKNHIHYDTTTTQYTQQPRSFPNGIIDTPTNDLTNTQTLNSLQLRIDKIENSINIMNSRLDSIMNLFEEILKSTKT